MCGPLVPWDWFILDVAYVMVLLGGSMVLRARNAPMGTWTAFGLLSLAVGTLLAHQTMAAQQAFAAAGPQPVGTFFAAATC